MKKSQNKKGVMKILEAVLASSILIVGLGFIFVPSFDKNLDDLKYQGYNALEHLDNSGKLRDIKSESEVNNALDPFINYKFKAVFCKYSCDKSGIPDKKVVVVIDYYISSYESETAIESDPKKLRLYLWE